MATTNFLFISCPTFFIWISRSNSLNMQRRYGSKFPVMCLGSIHGSNNPLQQHPRGRATGLPTMAPALLRGMSTSAARPEWYTEHRTPNTRPPLRWWRVVDERLHPSVGLVLRSLSLRATGTSPPTPPMMTDAEQIVMNEIRQHETVAAVIVSNSYRAVKSVQFSKDIRTFMVRAVEKGNTSKVGLTVDKVLDVLSLGENWVAFFTFAERNLIFGVAALGEGVLTLPEGIKTLGTVELLKHIKSTTKVKYRIYSAAEGLDTLANNDSAADRYNVLVKFVVDAVQHFVDRNVALYNAHSILSSPLFRGKKVRVARHNDITPIYITALKNDWTFLLGRHVDALERPLEWSGNEGNDSTVFFDLNDPDLWSSNPKEVVLIGGESGSGKTWKMMTNNSRGSHLVVYLRLTSRDYKTVTLNDRILHPSEGELKKSGKPTFSDREKERARGARSAAFLNLVKACVEVTIEAACPELLRMLQGKAGMSSNGGDPFEVRLCFDEMGSAPELIRACCAMGYDNLHEALEWEKWVIIRMFAAGTGVGTVVNPGGSENTFYKLATLAASQPDTNASQSDPNATRMYWKFRLALPFTEDLLALKAIVEELSGKWSDANQRSVVMLQRGSFLKEHKHKILMKEAKEVLVREALFSAVEADTVCRFVLTNARLATLVVARCNALATEIMKNTLCAWPSGIDVRREVLERVAKRFKELNSLSQTTPEEACVILVESLRYAIFDNYTNSNPNFSVETLTTARGVLVDNAIFLTTVGAEYEPVNNLKGPTFIYCSACYRKDLGRFSISPAMVVVLLALMLNAFGEKFNDIGAVFEHAVARFVFFAVQVFQGRHVKELVDFITGHFSVVGKTAQKILDSPSVLYDLPNSGLHTNHIISTK
ncbi:Hypothetical protein, putative [Bodo saltans]|uniref:Uncharacterized protein n=1 Tax=Bodo saltans TaxID=75058 RepID=A0A0S4JCE0_BODSA|nr:Hypothetical protein, putative [Bodo saltans]|eukprot:CUG89180.1 Hypothetical protein, putative [Bodo saltans]